MWVDYFGYDRDTWAVLAMAFYAGEGALIGGVAFSWTGYGQLFFAGAGGALGGYYGWRIGGAAYDITHSWYAYGIIGVGYAGYGVYRGWSSGP